MIVYSIEAALRSNLSDLYVTTDCHEIINLCIDLNVKYIVRPQTLAHDNAPMLPVIQHAIQDANIDCNSVMILQPTSPFRTHTDINNAINIFISDNDADSLVSVVKVPHNYMPEKLMEFDGKYLIGNNRPKRRQDLQLFYARNGAAIYITKFEKLKNYIFGGNILPYFMDIENSLDIDDYADWKTAEYIITSK